MTAQKRGRYSVALIEITGAKSLVYRYCLDCFGMGTLKIHNYYINTDTSTVSSDGIEDIGLKCQFTFNSDKKEREVMQSMEMK